MRREACRALLVCCLVVLCIPLASAQDFTEAEKESLTAFGQWLAGNGLGEHNLKIAAMGGGQGRGMYSTVDIPADSVVLSIPFKFMMTTRTAMESDIGNVFSDIPDINPMITLVVYLMYEHQNPKSNFASYLAILPKAFETTIYWTDEELKELQGTALLTFTLRRMEQLKEDYQRLFPDLLFKLYPTVFPADKFTLAEFQWATSVVWSRCFLFNVGAESVPVLVPFMDMFNHANVRTAFEVDEAKQEFRLRTAEAIGKETQIFAFLGGKSNAHLLLNYGHLLRENEHDTVLLNIMHSPEDLYHAPKSRILEQHGLPAGNQTYHLRADGLPDVMLQTMRVQLMRPAEFDRAARAFKGPISLANELEVCRQLIAAANHLLRQYPTTLEADAELLKAELPPRRRAAVQLRHDEKVILVRTIEAIARRWSAFLLDGFDEAAAPAPAPAAP